MAGIELLLIDGNNLLHRISGGVDEGTQRQLLARLQSVLPATIRTILMLDGHPASGTGRRHQVTKILEIHHAGSLSADDALLNLIKDRAAHTRAGVTLVSDDRALTDRARHLGAHTQRLAWLEQLFAAGSQPTVGIGGGKRRQGQAVEPEDPQREPWQPGRGATKKRGNPRRGRR